MSYDIVWYIIYKLSPCALNSCDTKQLFCFFKLVILLSPSIMRLRVRDLQHDGCLFHIPQSLNPPIHQKCTDIILNFYLNFDGVFGAYRLGRALGLMRHPRLRDCKSIFQNRIDLHAGSARSWWWHLLFPLSHLLLHGLSHNLSPGTQMIV